MKKKGGQGVKVVSKACHWCYHGPDERLVDFAISIEARRLVCSVHRRSYFHPLHPPVLPHEQINALVSLKAEVIWLRQHNDNAGPT